MKNEAFKLENSRILSLNSWLETHPSLVVGFTARKDGVSEGDYTSLNVGLHVHDRENAVKNNRSLVADSLLFPLERWVCSEQTHGNNVQEVTKEDCTKGVTNYDTAIKDTDGIYTKDKNILLTSFYADCVPIYFFAPKYGYIGLAHAGWKGTVLNIVSKMVIRWQEEGIPVDEIHVAIGPSIGGNCYIVDDRVKDGVHNVLDDMAIGTYKEVEKGQYALDLKEVNKRLAIKAGVFVENILVSHYCTCCEETLFFSHRRDKGKTGRMMSFIGMRSEELVNCE